jgi:hypothetical protein
VDEEIAMKTFTVTLAAFGILAAGASARADVMSSIQMNGVECFATYSPSEAEVTRSEKGIKASSTGALLTCPLSTASDDSADSVLPLFRNSTVYFAGTTPDYCYLASQERGTGSASYSANFVSGGSGKLISSGDFVANVYTQVVLICSLPANTTLRGFTSVERVSDISGGV